MTHTPQTMPQTMPQDMTTAARPRALPGALPERIPVTMRETPPPAPSEAPTLVPTLAPSEAAARTAGSRARRGPDQTPTLVPSGDVTGRRTPAGRAVCGGRSAALVACVLALGLAAEPALAQITPGAAGPGGVLDNVVAEIRTAFDRVGTRLGDIAWNALLSLLLVDCVLRAGRAMFSEDDLSGLIRGFAFHLGCVALTYGLIRVLPEFVDFLAATALDIAAAAGAPDVSASEFVVAGLERAVGWLGNISVTRPGTWFFLIASAVSVIVLAATVAFMIVIWAELYLCALAGSVSLMFVGLTETRAAGIKYVNGLVGKAFKLMGLLVIVAATGQMTDALAAMDGAGFDAAMGMILIQIVSLVLITTLPGALEGLIGNSFASRAGVMIGMLGGGLAAVVTGSAAGAALGAGAAGAGGGVRSAAAAARGGASATEIAKAATRGLGGGVVAGGWAGGKAGAGFGHDSARHGITRALGDRMRGKGGSGQ